MKFFVKVVFFFSAIVFFTVTLANVENNYHFTSPVQEQQFKRLISELRCLVCQNQSLAESNAPLAQDLKKEVYNQVSAGYSEMQIKHYLVQRYGEYILFKPSINNTTFILWLGPFIFLVGAFAILFLSIHRQRQRTHDIDSVTLQQNTKQIG
ncbi:MAG: cytochrome c-type biogenesis protein CcmH [Gammaproteobacteria bacterium]|nr:cytochrome c-type biogenesis protein CcmH [Gammaproteobacteria bacterium]